ncbi:MAG: phosphotransferase family protein, partial [Chloroflexi bacterium]|nr:phosphotransferase family protein [Chloroflexota bacterium]
MEAQLAHYLEARLPAEHVRVSNLSRIPGGASRETWMFDASWHDGGEEKVEAFVLRKDPPASLLETAREAEYAIYSTFRGSKVPVPRLRWLEPAASILGGPFFIMDRILGCESGPRVIIAPPFTDVQPEIARNMYEILAVISTLDWEGSPAARDAEAPTPATAWEKALGHR